MVSRGKKRVFFKKIMLAVTILGLSVSAFNINSCKVRAEGEDKWPAGIEIETPNAIVMDVNTGAILYEKNINERHYPASITKIFSTLIAVENCKLNEKVTFSADAIKNEIDASHIARDQGEVLTMEQCLYASMLESANECAYALAEHVGIKKGGNYRTFIDLMNSRAKEIGCKDSHFNNSNGMPDDQHYTTAYDMALISREAYNNPIFRKIMSTKKYTIPATNKHPEETYLINHHMMYYPRKTQKYLYEGCLGGKTGYTVVANSTLVTFVKRNDMILCCVVLNTKTPNHYLDTIRLFDYCFDNYKILKLSNYEKTIQYKGKKHKISSDKCIIVPKNVDYKEVEKNIKKVGKNLVVEYNYKGRKIGNINFKIPQKKVSTNPKKINKKNMKDANVGFAIIFVIVVIFVGITIYRKRKGYI